LAPGIEVRAVSGMAPGSADHAALSRALERSYEQTLDCPELCGLREIGDVIESHKAAGHWRADLWCLVFEHGQPEGCILLNHCPEHDTVELVYLGLSTQLRGRGIGRALLERALPQVARLGAESITCAVDRRNAPAMTLYKRLGFEEFSSRDALVRAFT
jgi:ribosomal protein S18 acetylase RimI-like enzyme